MGGAFLHLFPEAIEEFENGQAYLFVLSGFFLFLIIEKLIHWRHCHEGDCPVHTFAYMNLIGDGVHNFIDGMVISAGWLAGPEVGIASTIAVFLHEIPQEIGDFGVLVYAGITAKRALLFNFLSAVTAVIGAIFGFYLLSFSQIATKFLIAFAAGGFLYIAASDLIPEIRKEQAVKKSLIGFAVIILGIALMYLLKFLEVK